MHSGQNKSRAPLSDPLLCKEQKKILANINNNIGYVKYSCLLIFIFFFRFADDIELMTGQRPNLYWMFCWKYLSPAAMIAILISSIWELAVDGSGYDAWLSEKGGTERRPWPMWATMLAILLVGASVIWIPLVAICR